MYYYNVCHWDISGILLSQTIFIYQEAIYSNLHTNIDSVQTSAHQEIKINIFTFNTTDICRDPCN